jgi:hypothetical protein
VRTVLIWISGILASGIAGAIASMVALDDQRDVNALVGFVCGLCVFTCARLILRPVDIVFEPDA